MPFPSLRAYRPVHPERVTETPALYRESSSGRLRRLLEGGRWTVHDLINRAEIRAAVREQFRLAAWMEQDRQVEDYLRFLEREER